MGKGTIQSHLGEGRYSVQLSLHKERVQQRIDWLTDQIAKIDTEELQELETDLTEAQAEVDAAAQALDDLLTELENMNFWAPGTLYIAGTRIKLTARMFARCTIAGHSGSEVPHFPPQDGAVVREDTVIWQPYRPDVVFPLSAGIWQPNTEYTSGDLISVTSRDYEAKCTTGGRTGLGPNWPANGAFAYPDPKKENDKTTGPDVEDIAIEWQVVSDEKELTRLAEELAKAAAERDEAKVKRDVLKLRLTALEKDKEYLQNNTPEDPIIEAWCADLTTDLTGVVGVAVIPGERKGVSPVIRPGYSGAAVYDAMRDGQLQPAVSHTAPGVFYHWALRAAWQRWKPTYRLGTLTSLSGDTGDVALDEALSSDQNLPINQTDILVGVPIVYMSCNGAAFQVDDRVVVEFLSQDWEQPRVVGFESHPRSCPANIIWNPTYPSVPTGYFWSVTAGCTDNTCTWDFVDNGSYSFSGQGTKTLLPGEPNETSININGSFSHTHNHSMAHGTGDCPGIPYGPESWDHGTMSLADNRLITGLFPWSTETIYRRDQALNVTKTAGQNSGQSTDSVEKLVSAEWSSGTHHRTLVWHIQDKTTQYLVNDQAQETVTTLTRTTVVDETGTTTTDSNQTTTERTYNSDPFGPFGGFTTDSEGGDCVPVQTYSAEASGAGWPDPEDTSPVFG